MSDDVTVVVTRTARRGQEAAYERYLHEVSVAAHAWPGHRGVTVVRADRTFHLIFRFESLATLLAWEQSPERATWVARAAAFTEGPVAVRRLRGMEAWFPLPSTGTPPPRWKMAVLSFVAAFPTIQVLQALLVPVLSPLPALLRGAAVGAAMIVLMTYVLMPLLVRAARSWLT